ncbi:hypothetical protein Rs2_45398 [Raphanus sativus]|nr:hypothetical protein Rs2_45398 [Raphanus sativus]
MHLCIGASEKEVSDNYRILYLAIKNLVHLTDLGFLLPISTCSWGVLCWKRKAEEALTASGLNYALISSDSQAYRGMERPTDAYKETHKSYNLTLAVDDTLFGGQVGIVIFPSIL